MVKARKDLTGQKFNKLTVMYQVEDRVKNNGTHIARWKCKCDCGNETIVDGVALVRGRIKSCGCYKSEATRKYLREVKAQPNVYKFEGDTCICFNTNRTWCCYLDKEDYEKVKPYFWSSNNKGYITARGENKEPIMMHRYLMGLNHGDDRVVDHINGLVFDNRKTNLRICSHSQNMRNCKPRKSKTGIRGVTIDPKSNKWMAYITLNKKFKNLGYYDSLEDAIEARKKAEQEYFKEYGYDESQKNVTYPQTPYKYEVNSKYIDMFACVVLALMENSEISNEEKYSLIPSFLENLSDSLDLLEYCLRGK